MTLTEFQRELRESSPFDFNELRAMYVNCTLERSPQVSSTQGLIDVSVAIMEPLSADVPCRRYRRHTPPVRPPLQA
jgi:hypothetical protein